MKSHSTFTFVTKRLGFLKHIPLLAFQFDSMLRLWTLFTCPAILDCIDVIEAGISRWPGITRHLHKYGGLLFNYCGREVGHIHGNGILDIPFNRKTKAWLMTEGRINDHHAFPQSGWITFYIRHTGDHIYAQKLLRMRYDQIADRVDG